MKIETTLTILSIVLPLIGAIVGYFIKFLIEKKKELTNEITKERREIYQQYVNLIIDILSDSKIEAKKRPKDYIIKELYSFYKKYVLYASPNVIMAFSNYFQLIYKKNGGSKIETNTELKYLTKIMLEMRKDLGLKNNNLGKDGEVLIKALINDYDEQINPKSF